jgi:hypothetical protein
MPYTAPYDITPAIIAHGYDRQTCWVQTRGGVIPPRHAVITNQKLRLTGSDIFYGIHSRSSDDFGQTWTPPADQPGLGRQPGGEGTEFCPCDGTPAYHAASGKLLLTGHLAFYRNDELLHTPYPRQTWYSVYDQPTRTWSPARFLAMPDPQHFWNAGAGCTQRYDLPDGDILLPIYFASHDDLHSGAPRRYRVTVVRCRFDGQQLTYVTHGDELATDVPRGFGEPSLTAFQGRYFLTLRNDQRGYVTRGPDGLHFEQPIAWRWDDGTELGNYNTQQHWVTHSDALYLIYTRRGANNDHVFRHRAPLFIAQIDPERLCVLRETERVAVPERGARLGNFGIATASRDETWVIVSEWMQTTGPNPYDCTVCERYGADNAIWLSRIRWHRPNLLAP